MRHSTEEETRLKSFSRPAYFHGQLLGVHHFESEQEYIKRKLWMLNRMVSGYGVVCGLDLQVGDDDLSVVVTPGLALDRCGREIVVPCQSKKIPIEPMPAPDPAAPQPAGPCADDWVRVVICYCERQADPEPVLAGGCDSNDRCANGSIREGYEIHTLDGKAPEPCVDSNIPNLVKGNSVNYRALADWVSAPCDECHDPCIVLGNVRRPAVGGHVEAAHIDNSVRPIVFTPALLWQLVLALSHDSQNRRGGKNYVA